MAYRRWLIDKQGYSMGRDKPERVPTWFPPRPQCAICCTTSMVRQGLCSECGPLVPIARWSKSARMVLEARWDGGTKKMEAQNGND